MPNRTPNQVIQVITTTADKADADRLARGLLDERLAACVQIGGPVESSYWWNGRIETAREWVCTIKTYHELYPRLEAYLLEHHPYDEPEIVSLAAINVSPGYATWMRNQLNRDAATAPAAAPVPPAPASSDAPSPQPTAAAPASSEAPSSAANPASPPAEKRSKRKQTGKP